MRLIPHQNDPITFNKMKKSFLNIVNFILSHIDGNGWNIGAGAVLQINQLKKDFQNIISTALPRLENTKKKRPARTSQIFDISTAELLALFSNFLLQDFPPVLGSPLI